MVLDCIGDEEKAKEAVEAKNARSQEARVEPTVHCHELLDMNSPEGKYRGSKCRRTPQTLQSLQMLKS